MAEAVNRHKQMAAGKKIETGAGGKVPGYAKGGKVNPFAKKGGKKDCK